MTILKTKRKKISLKMSRMSDVKDVSSNIKPDKGQLDFTSRKLLTDFLANSLKN